MIRKQLCGVQATELGLDSESRTVANTEGA